MARRHFVILFFSDYTNLWRPLSYRFLGTFQSKRPRGGDQALVPRKAEDDGDLYSTNERELERTVENDVERLSEPAEQLVLPLNGQRRWA